MPPSVLRVTAGTKERHSLPDTVKAFAKCNPVLKRWDLGGGACWGNDCLEAFQHPYAKKKKKRANGSLMKVGAA